jgi:hypothetical protein
VGAKPEASAFQARRRAAHGAGPVFSAVDRQAIERHCVFHDTPPALTYKNEQAGFHYKLFCSGVSGRNFNVLQFDELAYMAATGQKVAPLCNFGRAFHQDEVL